MKLTARKTIVALGTAAALSLTGISAPAMAADDTNTTNTTNNGGNTMDDSNKDDSANGNADNAGDNNNSGDTSNDQSNSGTDNSSQNDESKDKNEGNAAYALRYRKVESAIKQLQKRIEELDGAIDSRSRVGNLDDDAKEKLADARSLRNRANSLLEDVKIEFSTLPKAEEGDNKGAAYGTLGALDTDLRTSTSLADDAFKAVNQAKPFECNSKTAEKDNSGMSSFLDFGSLFSALGSSGETIVEKNGKKTCVSNVEYFSDKLKSIVSILTVVFTVITTVTKISETIQKQAMPKR